MGRYVLHGMMARMTAPLDELSTAHAVVLEAPPNTAVRFEHDMLNLVARIQAQGPAVAIIVQPSLRRKSNKTLWVHRWNRLEHVPFKFRQTCSCKTGNAVPGCHLTCLIGASKEIDVSACAEVPTLSATAEATVTCLGGVLSTLCTCLLSADGDGGWILWPLTRRREWPRFVAPLLMVRTRHQGWLEGLARQGLKKHQTQLVTQLITEPMTTQLVSQLIA